MDATSSALRRALARARDGKTLDRSEATTLLQARGARLDELLAYAARTRDAGLDAAGRPGVITYSRKVFIPLTRLCRDRCGYCTFATVPHKLDSPYLSPDEVLEIARRGAEMGCKEALFTLGDRPEDRWKQAREWLDAHGYDDTLSYVRAMAIRVLEETGLLPHLNPGVLTWRDFQRLKPVAPSMGMMLETTATRLFSERGGPHFGSPDKDPAVRLRVLEDAGRTNVPFTTGILIGIGETVEERADAIFEIRRTMREYGAIQEVIVQNFRAKPDTKMRGVPDAELDELAATIAVTRLVLGPKARVQAPPNLVADQYALMLRAGIDDWGGVSPLTPDHVNPERPWPQIDELAERTAEAGFALRERLTIYPEYVRRGEPWLDPRLTGHVAALADPATGLAREDAVLEGRPWQEPDGGFEASGRTDLHTEIDTTGRTSDRRDDFDEVYGDWDALRDRMSAPSRFDADVKAALARAERDPGGLSDDEALALLHADGPELDALAALADGLRRDTVGDDVTYVVTRNINFTNVCYTGCRFCAFAQRRTDADAYTLSLEQVGDRVDEAWEAGATEICMQGGIHPDLPGTAYFDLAREVKKRAPDIHLHSYSPMEVVNGASRTDLSIREWLLAAKEAGVDSLPGTAAEILDDDVRWVLTKGKLPADQWVEVVTTAHELGIPTTSTMMYGHVDTPAHWVAHIKLLRSIQERTGGFSEFVLLPFVHHNSPIYLAGLARPGPTVRENIAVHALARILLHGAISNIQTSWVKLGDELCTRVLQGGVNDLGGTLMEETISRMAGSENGSFKPISELEAIAARAGRPARQRTTLYGEVPAERLEAARRTDGIGHFGRLSLTPVSRPV
ncbi:bifunctional FO biosynthesis protein CofGH [Actinomadura madurae]|uniref:bifunctional FO biosynthesis protein CofGH n=1 Tax=Actinomadura madurae TaxID=1993 RepID=UPI002026FBB7|nr:bifunctional FO biosynthesis protein CofGH [Actinomadura madurae]MCP9950550.1 bifunctional FO biosynthesis protein CofGH [Actinomadura madurae]MCP9967329.1 bifunctional FO biosynthesis protein CofGH [Actinomadura madurae]MCP9979789.1 bifunctional FO biosynthesis protein CofGH [Actinomadura madurae]URM96095.1 bifunctional FO biosynthesis protein CofGH [Actinomadura madurae]URN06796.1 bifunctional FO biosynthesis protein CofGH [Actinomadura madurae]